MGPLKYAHASHSNSVLEGAFPPSTPRHLKKKLTHKKNKSHQQSVFADGGFNHKVREIYFLLLSTLALRNYSLHKRTTDYNVLKLKTGSFVET